MSRYYCYDGTIEGPFYDTKAKARQECGPNETVRPIAESVVDGFDDIVDVAGGVVSDTEADSDDEATYSEWSHDDLKAEAADRGIADEVDLRSKAAIIEALESDSE